jgi:hypothetical protein
MWRDAPVRRATLVAALLVIASGSAAADDDELPREAPRRLSRDIILPSPDGKPEDGWFATHVRIRKGRGIAYQKSLKLGERELVFSIVGPIRRDATRRKRPGVAVELRF